MGWADILRMDCRSSVFHRSRHRLPAWSTVAGFAPAADAVPASRAPPPLQSRRAPRRTAALSRRGADAERRAACSPHRRAPRRHGDWGQDSGAAGKGRGREMRPPRRELSCRPSPPTNREQTSQSARFDFFFFREREERGGEASRVEKRRR